MRPLILAGFILILLLGCSRGGGVAAAYISGDVAGVMTVELSSDFTFSATLGTSKLTGSYTLNGEKITMQVTEIRGRAKREADDDPITGEFGEDRKVLRLNINSVQLELKRK